MASIELEIKNKVACIKLNRPEKFNSFNREMALSLQAVLKECAEIKEVRAILITGNGRAFCAGQDLAELTGENAVAMEKILKEHFNPIISLIRYLPKPVVAAVNGVAAGAGANIALCCDVVVASDAASFIQAFSKIGLVPDSGGTYFLPRLIGFQKASALMMLGDKVSAEEAEKMGMLYKVFPAEAFEKEAIQIAETLAAMPTRGLALTKECLNQSMKNDFDAQLQQEDDCQRMAAVTNDYAEGVAAFIEKRKPVFTGS